MPMEERRAQLLDAALGIAVERGFHAVTIDGVAKAAGVTRPVVYGLFADRSTLLAALVAQAEQDAMAQLGPALPAVPTPGEDIDPDELLLRGVTAFLTAVRDNPRTWRAILVPPEGAPTELHERLASRRSAVLAQLKELVAWGLDRRGGPADLDVELFAGALQTL